MDVILDVNFLFTFTLQIKLIHIMSGPHGCMWTTCMVDASIHQKKILESPELK